MLFLCSSFKFWCGCPRFFLLNFLLAENSWSVLTECDFVLWCLQSVGSMDLYQLGLTFEVGVWSVKKKKNSNLIRRYWILLISSNWLSYFCSSDFIFLWILVCYCPSNASVSVWGVGLCFAFLLVNAGIWILLDGACTIFVFMLLNYQSIQALQWSTFYVCSSVVFFFFLFFSFLFFSFWVSWFIFVFNWQKLVYVLLEIFFIFLGFLKFMFCSVLLEITGCVCLCSLHSSNLICVFLDFITVGRF